MIGRTNAGSVGGGDEGFKIVNIHAAPNETVIATDLFGQQIECVLDALGEGVIELKIGEGYVIVGSISNYQVILKIERSTSDINVYDESYEYWYGRKLVEPYDVIGNTPGSAYSGAEMFRNSYLEIPSSEYGEITGRYVFTQNQYPFVLSSSFYMYSSRNYPTGSDCYANAILVSGTNKRMNAPSSPLSGTYTANINSQVREVNLYAKTGYEKANVRLGYVHLYGYAYGKYKA